MAAPTNLRVEASSLSTTTLRWTYSGAAAVAVYRSTDGASYAVVAYISPGTTSYEDTGLSAGTKYWYKLSDDLGSTFSSVVTAWTQGCASPAVGGDGFSLPRFDGEDQQSDQLNNLAQRVEATLQGYVLDPQDCAACPEDGRVVIDCSDGCRSFVIIADQDINSISIEMCDEGDGNIDFIIPPNVTRQICGWPNGFGFGGDECFRAPIVTGAPGRTMSVPFSGSGRANPGGTKSKLGYGPGVGRGGGGGGAACTCVPGKAGQLTIKSCNANNSLKCNTTKSGDFIACGGQGPYTWSKTGTIQLSRTTGPTITVTPPTNAGSAVAGNAYAIAHYICVTTQCSGTNCPNVQSESEAVYGCNDAFIQCQGVTVGPVPSDAAVGAACCPEAAEERCPSGTCPNFGGGVNVFGDIRSALMISNGCAPCGIAAAGSTVTVTDSVGSQTTIILKA